MPTPSPPSLYPPHTEINKHWQVKNSKTKDTIVLNHPRSPERLGNYLHSKLHHLGPLCSLERNWLGEMLRVQLSPKRLICNADFLSFSYLSLPPEQPAAPSPSSWPNKICRVHHQNIFQIEIFFLPTSIKTSTLASLRCQDGAFCKLTGSESQLFEELVQIGRQIQK